MVLNMECFGDFSIAALLISPSPLVGDPNLKSGNGIPARCVYLEEMAADLEDQDWLDMENVEQVSACKHLMVSSPDWRLAGEG